MRHPTPRAVLAHITGPSHRVHALFDTYRGVLDCSDRATTPRPRSRRHPALTLSGSCSKATTRYSPNDTHRLSTLPPRTCCTTGRISSRRLCGCPTKAAQPSAVYATWNKNVPFTRPLDSRASATKKCVLNLPGPLAGVTAFPQLHAACRTNPWATEMRRRVRQSGHHGTNPRGPELNLD